MQAFERARLVAVDVVAEMQPLGEPDEYVNLSPTTGPVPVMVANSERPPERTTADEAPVEDVTGEPAAEADEAVGPDAEPPEAEAVGHDHPGDAAAAESTVREASSWATPRLRPLMASGLVSSTVTVTIEPAAPV